MRCVSCFVDVAQFLSHVVSTVILGWSFKQNNLELIHVGFLYYCCLTCNGYLRVEGTIVGCRDQCRAHFGTAMNLQAP
jgi:hypothetical protein